jgi:hypothetical protein
MKLLIVGEDGLRILILMARINNPFLNFNRENEKDPEGSGARE